MNFPPKRSMAFKVFWKYSLWHFFFKYAKFYLFKCTSWKVTKDQSKGTSEILKIFNRNIHSNSFIWWCIRSSKFCSTLNLLLRNFGSIRYTHVEVDSRRGYFSNSIDSGEDKTYNANQICDMADFLIDNIFRKFGDTFLVRSLEFQWVPAVPPSLLTCFFILAKVIFQITWWEVATGNLPDHLTYVSNIPMT